MLSTIVAKWGFPYCHVSIKANVAYQQHHAILNIVCGGGRILARSRWRCATARKRLTAIKHCNLQDCGDAKLTEENHIPSNDLLNKVGDNDLRVQQAVILQ
jgi:hypothetical protein